MRFYIEFALSSAEINQFDPGATNQFRHGSSAVAYRMTQF